MSFAITVEPLTLQLRSLYPGDPNEPRPVEALPAEKRAFGRYLNNLIMEDMKERHHFVAIQPCETAMHYIATMEDGSKVLALCWPAD